MITRPLELASRLQPAPRNFDAWFFVNGGLIVLFFLLFGSRFVLAPGLGVSFQLPTMPGAVAGAASTTHRISVVRSDLIYALDEGAINMRELRTWLQREAKRTHKPSLLVLVAAGVPTSDFAEIASAAHAAGFVHVHMGAQEPASSVSAAR
jgi:biopolymer transport protein ExbD